MKYKDFLELMRKKLLDAKGKDDKTEINRIIYY